MKQQTEEQQARMRKALLVLPIVIVFAAALIFVALGGGKGQPNAQAANTKGINTRLPDAKFGKEQPQDKLSLYDQAARDSVKAKNNANNPLFNQYKPDNAKKAGYVSADASAEKINQKLAEIGRTLNRPEPAVKPGLNNSYPAYGQNSPETDKLEKMLQAMHSKNADDPELKQLNVMLDKIAAIQNPGAVQPAAKPDKPAKPDSAFNAIAAIIEGSQKVAQGGVVKLRLLDTILLKNITIPKGQLLFGSCNITNQRLLLDIKNVRLGDAIIPVDLSVFSLDGLPGIDAPEAELAEAGGTGTANALQSMEFLPMDMSLTTQAASAGISAAKSLIGKKVKKIKVKLHGGQRILLRNNQLKTR